MEQQTITSRIKNAWNAFLNKDPTPERNYSYNYYSSSYRPDRMRFSRGNERTTVTSVYNRIAMDVAAVDIKHVRLDDNERYVETINSGLNECLTLSANVDQTGRALIQDAVMSLFDEGVIAIVPTDTYMDPTKSSSYDIESMRVGKITQWFPDKVKVLLYNEKTGKKEEVILPKKMVAIIENPLYAVINEPNSTMQRLIRKLALLDLVDSQTSSGKLDLIIQLPYIIKTDARRAQAEDRIRQIEEQLTNSKYGVAYTDGTEKIVQLNRSLENNLLKQVEYLTELLYSQLGITKAVMDGTADAKVMLNYYDRTLEPILSAIVLEMRRKFLTKTARTQGQSIKYFRDPFKLVPVADLAEIADKFTRNCIATSNEIRQVIGWKPSDDPTADRLVNNNLSQPVGDSYSQEDPNAMEDSYAQEDPNYMEDSYDEEESSVPLSQMSVSELMGENNSDYGQDIDSENEPIGEMPISKLMNLRQDGYREERPREFASIPISELMSNAPDASKVSESRPIGQVPVKDLMKKTRR